MFFRRKKGGGPDIYSPTRGRFVRFADVADSTFSSGIMGCGLAIEPDEELVRSPINGEVTMLFPTKHAIGIKREDGLEILIHIGIETVNLGGEGFESYVKVNDHVKAGESMIKFNRALIKDKKLDATVIVVFPNGKDYNVSINEALQNITEKDVVANVERKL